MKTIRLSLTQNEAHYGKPETIDNKMTYPLPPFSTVIGTIHKACGYQTYRPMDISIQGDYQSLKKELYRRKCVLNNTCDDRGTLEYHPRNMISNVVIQVAKSKGRNSSFMKNINIQILNNDTYELYVSTRKSYTAARVEKSEHSLKIKEYKKDKNMQKIKKKQYQDDPEYIELLGKEKEINERIEQYQKILDQFYCTEFIPSYQEVLYGVSLIIHIQSDEEMINDILSHIDNIQSLGRREDFIDIKEAKIINLTQNDINACIPTHVYVNANDIDNFSEINNGTRYLLPKNYAIGEGIRQFEKVPCIYTSSVKIKNFSDTIYVDEDGYVVNFN